MSSFRPDIEAEAPTFVATSYAPRGWEGADSANATPLGALDAQQSAIGTEPLDAVDSAIGPESVDGRGVEPLPGAPTAEEIEALEQAAFARGVESARAANAALEATCRTVDAAVAELRAAAAARITENRNLVLDLAADLVRDWVQQELATDPSRQAALVDQALDGLELADGARLTLATPDLDRLREAAPEALARWTEAGLGVEADEALSPGGFRVIAPTSTVEGDIDVALSRLRASLAPAVAASDPEVEG